MAIRRSRGLRFGSTNYYHVADTLLDEVDLVRYKLPRSRPFEVEDRTWKGKAVQERTVNRNEFQVLQEKISKHNNAMALKHKFSANNKGRVLAIDREGKLKQQAMSHTHNGHSDDIDDEAIDQFLAEMELKDKDIEVDQETQELVTPMIHATFKSDPDLDRWIDI